MPVESLNKSGNDWPEGVIDGSVPGDLAREEYERIDSERDESRRLLAAAESAQARIDEGLELALLLVGRCDEIYRRGGKRTRRLMNQCLFEKLVVSDENVVGSNHVAPWSTLLEDDFIKRMRGRASQARRTRGSLGGGSNLEDLVPPVRRSSNKRSGSNISALAPPAVPEFTT